MVGVDPEVEPAVVVVVPEPAGEAVGRPGDAEHGGDIDERAVASIVIEPIAVGQVGDVEVGQAVVVVVAPGHSLAEPIVGHAGRDGDVLEGAVAAIVVEPAQVAKVGAAGVELAGDIEVDVAVVVVVGPAGRLRGDRLAEAGRQGDVLENAAAVAQERHPPRHFPGASKHQDVEIAVVVEVGVAGVQRQDLVGQAGLVRDVLEGAVAAIAQEQCPPLGVGRGHEDVEPAVAVEVVDQAPAGHRLAARVEPDAGRHVDHPPRVVPRRGKPAQRQEELRRNAVGVLSQRHVRDVQEPLDAQVLRLLSQVAREVLDRLARAGGPAMDGGGGEGKDAARLVATGHAVLDLAAPQGGHSPQGVQFRPVTGAAGPGRRSEPGRIARLPRSTDPRASRG